MVERGSWAGASRFSKQVDSNLFKSLQVSLSLSGSSQRRWKVLLCRELELDEPLQRPPVFSGG